MGLFSTMPSKDSSSQSTSDSSVEVAGEMDDYRQRRIDGRRVYVHPRADKARKYLKGLDSSESNVLFDHARKHHSNETEFEYGHKDYTLTRLGRKEYKLELR